MKITTEELEQMKAENDEASFSILQKILHNYVIWAFVLVIVPFFVVMVLFGNLSEYNQDDSTRVLTPTKTIILSTPVPRDGDGRRIGGTPGISPPSLGLTLAPTSRAASILRITESATDTEAPQTQILYPLPGAELARATGGKVCVIFSPLQDNKSKTENITLTYSFDARASTTVNGAGAACADNIYNGLHSFVYYLTDQAGNKSETKSLQLTVNISGFEAPTATPIALTSTPTPSPSSSPTPTAVVTPTP